MEIMNGEGSCCEGFYSFSDFSRKFYLSFLLQFLVSVFQARRSRLCVGGRGGLVTMAVDETLTGRIRVLIFVSPSGQVLSDGDDGS